MRSMQYNSYTDTTKGTNMYTVMAKLNGEWIVYQTWGLLTLAQGTVHTLDRKGIEAYIA